MAQTKTTSNSGGNVNNTGKGFMFAVLAIVVVGLAAVAFVVAGGDDDTTAAGDGQETGTVEVTGNSLTPKPGDVQISDAGNDPSAGEVAPTLVGTAFDGSEVRIEPDGEAKAIYFLAHWCPHCQEEAPLLQELVDAGEVPEGMTVYAVSTAVQSGQGNYPPSAWLEREGFSSQVLRDDEGGTAFTNYGGTGYPFAVYLDAEHRVVARSSGNLDAQTTTQLWDLTLG